MKIAAIIPVKTFSKAKTRLNLDPDQKEELCKIMLEQVVDTISKTNQIEKILIVSKDEQALKLVKKYNTKEIFDNEEMGVNHAISLSDKYISDNGYDVSIIFPQDIPFIQSKDIETLIKFKKSFQSVLIVPSRRFDGTNALLRFPSTIMDTHYDEDSYKIHLEVGKSVCKNTSLVLLSRIMFDIDNQEDLKFLLSSNGNSKIINKLSKFANLLVN